MKYFLLLIILIAYLSCDKNPVFKIYQPIDYTVTVRIQNEDGTPFTNAWIGRFAYDSPENYYADDNGEISIKFTQHFHENDTVPDHIPVNSSIYPCDSSYINLLVRYIPLTRGMEYPLFIIECHSKKHDYSTLTTQ